MAEKVQIELSSSVSAQLTFRDLNMALKVVHINRKKLDVDAETQAFSENVLKPKWEERARLRGKLKIELAHNREALDHSNINRPLH